MSKQESTVSSGEAEAGLSCLQLLLFTLELLGAPVLQPEQLRGPGAPRQTEDGLASA